MMLKSVGVGVGMSSRSDRGGHSGVVDWDGSIDYNSKSSSSSPEVLSS